MLSVCVFVCLGVNQGGINRNSCTETCNLACNDLLMSPDCTPITKSLRPTLLVNMAAKKVRIAGFFKPAEPHSPWDAR